ncbi:MAG: hypothetical protein LUO93_09310 [Methanomicrobiales archaeon]|nr:hypothetical protein [Methanomicrobiales archaeon]
MIGNIPKNRFWTLFLVLALTGLSIVLYFIHLLLFQDLHHIGIFFLGDLAFLPLEVLLVTLIIHRLLEMQDRQRKMEKMHMVIGAFFSSVGSWLLAYLSDRDPALEDLRRHLVSSLTGGPMMNSEGSLTNFNTIRAISTGALWIWPF